MLRFFKKKTIEATDTATIDVAKVHDDAPSVAPDVEVAATQTEAPVEPQAHSWLKRLQKGLAKTRDKLGKSLASVFGGGQIDDALYEDLEAVLLSADLGLPATEALLADVRDKVSLRGLKDPIELRTVLKESLLALISPLERSFSWPQQPTSDALFVVMMVGVNGAGKTTSIGKLAKHAQTQGQSVMLAAGDTFRAAAKEQLQVWGERNGVLVLAQTEGDSASVCYDAVKMAKARGIDILLADTAGRLPTQLHLMAEIAKVKRVLQKADAATPQEIWLVLDATVGQNALSQIKAFNDALGLTGLIMTKLDGSAKGGVIAAIAKTCPVPIVFIGVGEQLDDLQPFKARDFVDALFDEGASL